MEIEIVKFLNHWGNGAVDWVAELLSAYNFLFVLWYSAAIFFLISDKRNGKKIFLGSLIATALYILIGEFLFKHILTYFWGVRPRPYAAFPNEIIPLGKHNIDSSFPSNHMVSTLAMLTVFVYYYRKLVIPGVILAILMAFARMHNGMHYPSDIVAGSIIGILIGLVAVYFGKKIKFRIKKEEGL